MRHNGYKAPLLTMVNIALEQRPALPRIQGLGDKAGTGSQADLTGRRLTRPANGELRDFTEYR